MSKPLELVVHPPVPPKPQPNTTGNLWGWELDRALEEIIGDSKRLTDAELAAEYWSSAAEAALELAGEIDETDAPLQALTLRRFATHPHYDEDA